LEAAWNNVWINGFYQHRNPLSARRRYRMQVWRTGQAARPNAAFQVGAIVYTCTQHMRKEYNFSQGKRGAVVPVPAGKTRVTIRLDTDVLDWFRDEVDNAGGGNYQSLINLALRDFVIRSKEPLEKTLRRVIREELRRAG
jgi:uncharacterized protein (DUF4415 family)